MKSMNQKAQAGFTLIELMIVVAIIGILAAVAIPAYQNYVKRAAYTEVVAQMSPYKLAVEEGFQNGLALNDMDAPTNGAAATNLPTTPTAVAAPEVFNSLAVENGIITATPNAVKGIAATDTCVLTPVVAGGADAASGSQRLSWQYSGACVTNGYVKN